MQKICCCRFGSHYIAWGKAVKIRENPSYEPINYVLSRSAAKNATFATMLSVTEALGAKENSDY